MLQIKIIETGKIETLSVYGKNGIDWATDFISDGGNQHDDDGNTLMTQADFDFWSDACDKQQQIDDYLDTLGSEEYDTVQNKICDALAGINDLDMDLYIRMGIIMEHKLSKLAGSTWGEIDSDTKDELLKMASPISGIDSSTVLSGPCIVDLLDHLSIVGYVEGDEIKIDDDAEFYDPIA